MARFALSESRSSCVTSSASSRRRRLTNVFMASLALASFDVILVVIVWGCLHDGAHTLQRELYVWLARLVNGAPAPARTPAIAEYRAPGRCRPSIAFRVLRFAEGDSISRVSVSQDRKSTRLNSSHL